MMMEENCLSAKELIRSTFTSRVAVLCTPSADSIVQKLNLNFVQLVQPFAKLSTEATWQDPNGQLIIPKDIHLNLVDIGGNWKKPETDVHKNRRLLTNVVTQTPPPLSSSSSTSSSVSSDLTSVKLTGKSLDYEVTLPKRTRWFECWRKTFLKLQSEIYGSQHEFLNHFVACVLVISASEVKGSDDVASIVGKLSKVQQQHQYDHPNTWILPSVLKYYLILQDSQINENEAEQAYQNFRTMYGGNFCHMLKIAVEKDSPESEVLVPNPWKCQIDLENSLRDTVTLHNKDDVFDGKSPLEEVESENVVQSDLLHPLSPDCEKAPPIVSQNGDISNGILNTGETDYGATLTFQDVRRIQLVVNEFISKALLPYMERQCRNLHESILNRRGMSKSFFSATKRLFGTSSKNTPSIVYASESVEILSRKLADIYFLFGHYGGAYQLYHQLKKDFYGDAAWLYYSSALELAAISHFMMSQSEPPLAVARAFPVHYVNDAIGHYIDQCRMVEAATRCAVLCAECLKHLENHSECAAIFIRMTSEDCDLRSALMLEQASYHFLEMKSPRKYALHSVLAGYRYAKAGLKQHSLNSYRQGYQIYNRKGWRFAEDHVNFTIARLQNILQIPEGITVHLMSTLVSPSPQPVSQTQSFYKEFLSTLTTLKSSTNNAPCEFFVPEVKFSDMQIRIAVTDLPVGEFDSVIPVQFDRTPSNWDSLEENVVKECISTNHHHSVISFKPTRLLFNPLIDNTVNPTVPCDEEFFIELPFFNPLKIALVVRNVTLKFDRSSDVKINTVSQLELDPEATKLIRFSITSHHIGTITFEAVTYELEFSGYCVAFQQRVKLKGPRLNATKAERAGKIYAKDLRNQIVIIDKLPLLQARVSDLPEAFFHAQTANFQIVLEDKSKWKGENMTISRVIIAATAMEKNLQVLPVPSGDNNNSLTLHSTGKNFTQLNCGKAKQITNIPCVFKAPQSGESAALDILILYEILNREDPAKKSHRVIRVTIKAPISPAVHMEYSSLKLLDCFNYLGLLRLYNLTVDFNIVVNKIFFTPSDITVTDVCTQSQITHQGAATPGSVQKEVVKINQNESRNVVLKFRSAEKTVTKKRGDININIQWQIENSELGSILAVGHSEMRVNEAVAEIESSFVFQVKHPDTVYSDFEKATVCYCEVELKVHSRKSGRFSIQLESNPPKEDLTSSGPSLRASGDIFICGKSTWKLELEALKTESMMYKLGVAWPGVYNAAPNVIVTDEEEGVQETYSLHSPVIVAHQLQQQ